MNEVTLNQETIKAIKELSIAAAGELVKIELQGPAEAAGLPSSVPALLRIGQTPQIVSIKDEIEKWRTSPERRSGTAKASNLDSFIELVNRHKDAHSAIFGATDLAEPKLTAVIDYHQTDGKPRFGKHRIEYAFPLSDEWTAWIEHNGADKTMGQGDFSAWLEDHIAELSAPYEGEVSELEPLFKTRIGTPNEIISLSRELEIHVKSHLKHASTLQSGEREIIFSEEHSNVAGEKLVIPGLFIVAVPPFIDAEPLRIPTRLRYRNTSNGVKWFYEMYRVDFWLRQEIKNALDKAANETGLPAYEGAPEA